MPTEVEDSPLVRLVNMVLLNMIKKRTRAVRIRADAHPEEWDGAGWTELMSPPEKLRLPMIERLQLMADIPDDAPLRFDAPIRLRTTPSGVDFDFDVSYARSRGGGVMVVMLEDALRDPPGSDTKLVHKAWIQLARAEEALGRDEIRAGVRDAVERLKDDPGRKWLLRNAARACVAAGLYDDALAYIERARPLHEDDPMKRSVLETWHGLALVEMNRAAEGEEKLRLARALAEASREPHMLELQPLVLLAEVALDRGDPDEAERCLARFDAVIDRFLGPGTAAHSLAHAMHVRLARERGDAAEAEKLAMAWITEAEENGLVSEAERIREQLGEIALARGDAKAAIHHLREVLQLRSSSPMRARTYATLARAQRAMGRDADAVSSLRAATALADGALAPDHPLRIEVDRELATLTATAPYR